MTLYLNALRLQRLALVCWALALGAMNVAVIASAGALDTGQLGELLSGMPPALRNLMGGDLLLTRPVDGLVNSKILEYMPLLVGIYVAFQAAALLAREEERHTLDFLLSLPVSRPQLLLSRLAGLLTGAALLWAAALAVLAVTMRQHGLVGDWAGYLRAAAVGLLLNGALGAVCLWISAGTGDYRRTLRLALGLTVATYMIDLGLRAAQAGPGWRWLTPYGLYRSAEILLTHRFPWPEALVLGAAAAAAAWLAVRTFGRREVL